MDYVVVIETKVLIDLSCWANTQKKLLSALELCKTGRIIVNKVEFSWLFIHFCGRQNSEMTPPPQL